MSAPLHYLRMNQEHWDELVPLHRDSEFYDVAGFRAGRCTLMPMEPAEVGDVSGLELLHLQCHFGLDSLSWARRGARVTGVDFSAPAVELARRLAAELDLPATFHCARVDPPPAELAGRFDVVYVSNGALCWLPDLHPWAAGVARCLVPGGRLYLAEIHPAGSAMEQDANGAMRVAYPYLYRQEPECYADDESYAAGRTERSHRTVFEWCYGLGDVVSALTGAGLRLHFLHEWPFTCYQSHSGMVRTADGTWSMPGFERFPFHYSLMAQKPISPGM